MNRLYKGDIFPTQEFHIDRTLISDNKWLQPHCHDFYELFIVEEGELEHHRNGESELMTADCLALVFPEDNHTFIRRKSQPLRFFNIAFTVEVYEQATVLAQQCGTAVVKEALTPVTVLPRELSRQFLRRMKWLRNESQQIPPTVRHTMLITLLADMLTVVVAGSGQVQSMPLWLRTACEEMRKPENLAGGIPRFVELSGKTQEHLTRSMKKYADQTPSAYVNAVRLERAAEALSTTERSVLEIMLEVGFQNTSYFNKRFKERYHMSPREYRQGTLTLFGKNG